MEFLMTRKAALAMVILTIMASLLFCSEDNKKSQDNPKAKVDDIETLFKQASTAESDGDFGKAVGYYAQIIESYPDSDKRDKALFMAGYLNYEGLKNKDAALKYFNELLTKYPSSDLADDAEFMIKAIGSGKDALTTFEEENK
jgi:outer membrane protein assembly factor BamD (BamD/ComL family)